MKKALIYFLICFTAFCNISAQMSLDSITTSDSTVSETPDAETIASTADATGPSTRSGTVVNANVLNVRRIPWGTIIGKLHKTDSVTIIGESSDKKWYKISYNGSAAYVYKSYIRAGAVNSETPATQTRSGTITAGSLNVRATIWGTKIGILRKNERVSILDESQGWYKISYKGKTGWISGKYVKLSTGSSENTEPDNNIPVSDNQSGTQYGYDAKKYGPVLELCKKYSQVNQQYVLGKGHVYNSGYVTKSDCSGFTAQFYQKLAKAAGVTPVVPYKDWTPVSTDFKQTKYTKKITSQFPPPNPRDLIHPGDIFVMDKKDKSYGHIGVFVGYNSAGEPLIAHSTSTTVKSDALYGNMGKTGVRIEPMPRRYQSRYAGMYRFNNMDEILSKLQNT